MPILKQQELPPPPAGGGEQHKPPQTSMPGARPRPSACTRSSLSPLFSVRLTAGRREGGTGSRSSDGSGCPLDRVALTCWGGVAVTQSGLSVQIAVAWWAQHTRDQGWPEGKEPGRVWEQGDRDGTRHGNRARVQIRRWDRNAKMGKSTG